MSGQEIPPNVSECGEQQKQVLASLQRRAAAGQIGRRAFLQLALAIGIGPAFAAAWADRAMASPQLQGRGGRNIEASYDYIIVGAGSAGCAIAAALCAAVEHCRAIGSAAALSEWRKREIAAIPAGKSELREFVARNIGSYWHPVGTCAMGVDEEAVVDPFLRVYGTAGLRVADASIMPAITSGNTNAPAIMIAERAAQMLRSAN